LQLHRPRLTSPTAFSLYWGYNRAQFSASSIHFTGADYDFILHDVLAKDKPEAFTLNNYFNPKNIWIPQYNYRVGWFFNDRWSFSLGLDHMKYVVVQGQQVALNGTIAPLAFGCLCHLRGNW
jgi:hypothetical protein